MKSIKRIFSIFLAVLMCFCIMPVSELGMQASAYSERTTAPSSDNAYYYNSSYNPFAGSYVGQCTWYAFGRAYEILGYKPNLSTRNGNYWYADNISKGAFKYGSTPKVGSIMVTQNTSSSGHVAVVERLNSNGTMMISEYNWNVSKGFKTETISQSATTRGTQTVLGYIYLLDGSSSGGGSSSGSFTTNIDNAPSDWQTFDIATTTSFNVAGWAFRNNGKHTSVYYCFDNNGYTKLNSLDRPDVVNVYGNSQLDCGFNQNIDISGLSVGNHTFKLWCSSNGVDHDMYYIGITITNSNATTSPNGIEYRNHSISDISTKDARIKMWISNPTGKTIWSTGFWFGTDPDNLSLYVVNTKINWTDFCSDYKISDYYGELSPGITYYYRFYVIEEENFYYTQSNMYSFTTYGIDNVRFDHIETTAKSSLDANISAWAWNDVGYTISSYGFYLGESPTTMKKYQVYENIAWTNFHTQVAVADYTGVLTPGKTYYYRFYAVIDTNYYSDIYSFTTDSTLPVFTTTFNANGGTCSTGNKAVTYGNTYGTLPTPTRTGYNFDGWYTAATGGTKVTSSTTVTAIGNHTLYAHWSCKHSTTELRNVKAATCSAEGYTGDTYCKTCGTKTKSGTAVAKLTHSYTSTITTAPTCTQAGVKTFTCSKCGDKYTETVAKKGHAEVTVAGKAATCTATGLTDGKKCSVCGTVTVAQQTIAKKGHTEITVKGKAATCTATGLTDGKKCSVCGTVTVAQKTIAKKAHTEVVDKAVSATCTKTGLTEGKHCSVCNTVIVAQTVVPVKNHSYSSWKQTKAPTCTSAGEKQRSCSSCGKTEKQAVAIIDHTYTTEIIEPTCSENGMTIYICSECRYSYNEDIPATGHADKDSDGACDGCGEVMSDKSEKCSCMCHKSGFMGFIWKILRIFYKLFKANPVCNCGVKHY